MLSSVAESAAYGVHYPTAPASARCPGVGAVKRKNATRLAPAFAEFCRMFVRAGYTGVCMGPAVCNSTGVG